ncbi:hypothetical protein [Streptomyces yerevanensis]|uniref:hypothetical protein n=1 Tax=Streptomyces yerevanensis TaxID=66378 RepID=UPI00052475FB|nr:hypothetical protein [Streptomyces yerevanensis]
MTLNADGDDRIADLLAHFGGQSANPVLSFLDAEGLPFSIRCGARWTGESFLLKTLPSGPGAPPGRVPASLLWHHHDESLEDQRSVMLHGTLEQKEGRHEPGAVFRPTAPPVVVGLEPVDVEALFRTFNRRSDAYLERHSLQPPQVDWEALERIIAKVRAEPRTR